MAETGGSRRRARLGRRGRRIAAGLGLLAVLVLAVRAALPALVGYGLRRTARAELGVELAIGDVDLGLFQARLALEEIAAAPAAGADADPGEQSAPPFLRADRLSFDLAWHALAERRLHLSEVAIEAPRLRLERRADGSLAPLRGETDAAEAPEPAPPPDAPPPGETPDAGAGEKPAEAGWPLHVEHLALRAAELRLTEVGGSEPLAEASLGALEARRLDVREGVATLASLALRSPRVRVREALVRPPPPDAAAETEDAKAGAAREPPDAEEAPAGAVPAHRLRRIAVEDGVLVLVTEEGPIEGRLDLRASGVSALPGERFPLEASLALAEGSLELEGRAGLAPPSLEGRLELEDLALPRLARALAPERAPSLRAGRASGALALVVRGGPPPEAPEAPLLQLSGDLDVAGLDWRGSKDGALEALAWKRLELAIGELRVPGGADAGGAREPARIDVERLALEEPRVRVLRAAAGAAPSAGAEEEPEAEAAETPPPVRVRLRAVELSGGEAELVDRTVEPALRSALSGLALSAEELRWPGPRAGSLTASGRLRDARLELEGALAESAGRLRLDLDGLGLAPLDPYLLAAAGFGVDGGSGSLASELELDGEIVSGEGHLVLRDLDVGHSAEGAFARTFGVPLDLALALLRDPSGAVSLRIPLSGPVSELRAHTATVVVSALRQALVGTLSTPLKALGAVIPQRGDEAVQVEPLPALPGRARLRPEARERADALAELLASRPALAVALRGRAGPADRAALAEALLAERALAGEELPETPGLEDSERDRLAEALQERGDDERELDPEERALLERAREAVAVPDARLRALARARAERLRARLVEQGETAPERVRVLDPAPPGEPAVLAELEPRR